MNTHNEDDHPQDVQPPEMMPSSREEQPLEREPISEEGHSGTSPPPRLKRNWQFAAGFLGWFLVNGLLWLLITGGGADSWVNSIANLCVLPLNLIIVVLLLASKKARSIGNGIMVAFGVNLIISLILGLSNNAVCLVPFFFAE